NWSSRRETRMALSTPPLARTATDVREMSAGKDREVLAENCMVRRPSAKLGHNYTPGRTAKIIRYPPQRALFLKLCSENWRAPAVALGISAMLIHARIQQTPGLSCNTQRPGTAR